ncbi:hypothetical protein ACFY00_31050 [Kitasatospora sp. NPDC001540]|uniref:hypothetical protein n=1 Tax=Kitasatospora sp. NPDC001540 TaxID=3364014 RepID=UPI00367CA1F0
MVTTDTTDTTVVTAPNTYLRLAARLHELGTVDAERYAEACAYLADFPEPGRARRTEELVETFLQCGLAFSVHGEDVDDAGSAYAWILDEAAAVLGPGTGITDVELLGEPGGSRELRFRVNDAEKSWWIEQESDDYLDQGAVHENVADLLPDRSLDPRVFHCLPGLDACADDHYLLATPEHAALLRDEFALRIEVRGPDGLPVREDREDAAP